MTSPPRQAVSIVRLFRTMALLTGVGMCMSAWPIYHRHTVEEGDDHPVHVHAHGGHVHHTHGHHDHSHPHCHSDPHSESPADPESEGSAHLHLLILESEVPHTPDCTIPRPLLSCLGIVHSTPIEAAETLSLRIPEARAPPGAHHDERHLI